MIHKKEKTYDFDLALVKKHLRLRLENTADDDFLNHLIKTAITDAENYIEKDIVHTLNDITVLNFSGNLYTVNSPIEITTGSTVQAYVNDEEITIKNVYYDTYRTFITLDDSYDDVTLKISYTSGKPYENIPFNVVHAILIKIAEYYDVDRQGVISNTIKFTKCFENLLNSEKLV